MLWSMEGQVCASDPRPRWETLLGYRTCVDLV